MTTVDPTVLAFSNPQLNHVGKHIGQAVNYWRAGDGTTVRGAGVVNIQLYERDRQNKKTTEFIHVNMLDIAAPKVLTGISRELRYIQMTQ